MTLPDFNTRDESKQLITAWANSTIQSAKQLMFDGEAYLIALLGLPWYRQSNDAWIDHLWWIETAQFRYERYRSLPNRWIIDELEILIHHCPSTYRDDARQRIEQWYQESAHDAEDWWNLAMLVYPEHSLFEDLHQCPPGNYLQWAILASLGYEDAISTVHNELLIECGNQDWFWVSDILSCFASVGGQPLVDSIVSEVELQQIRYSIKVLFDELSSEEEAVESQFILRTAIRLEWQDVINVLSENQSCLKQITLHDILWWSLTDKKQLVEDFILKVSPHTFRLNKLAPSQINLNHLSLAISWKRAMSV